MIEYGLANASLDAEIRAGIKDKDGTLSEEEMLVEMNKVKKKLTHFNEKNTKYKSTKKVKDK